MYHTMRWRPEQPRDPGADRLVLSEGHAVPIIYAACAHLGATFCPHGQAGQPLIPLLRPTNPNYLTDEELMAIAAGADRTNEAV
jgi:hypothetical protein